MARSTGSTGGRCLGLWGAFDAMLESQANCRLDLEADPPGCTKTPRSELWMHANASEAMRIKVTEAPGRLSLEALARPGRRTFGWRLAPLLASKRIDRWNQEAPPRAVRVTGGSIRIMASEIHLGCAVGLPLL